MRRMFLAVGLCAVCSASAQVSAPVQAPPLGAEFDSSSGLLSPILGVPGSARLGSTFALGPFAVASVASQRDFAMASDRTSGQVSVVAFTATDAKEQTIAGASAFPDKIILSPSGTAAILWHSGQLKTEVVTGLPATPRLRTVALSGIQRDPDLLAVSDDGNLVAVFNEGLQATLERFPETGAPATLSYVTVLTAITFLRRSDDALLADGSRLVFLRNAAKGDMSTELLLDHVPSPAGTQLAVSRDNSRAMLASPGHGQLELIALSGKEAPVSASCECSVQQLTALRGRLTFLLTRSSGGPATVVDGSGSEPVFSLIPSRSGASN